MPEISVTVIPLWREVTIGIFKDPEAYLDEIERRKLRVMKGSGMCVDTRDVIRRVSFAQEERRVSLVKASPFEAGFSDYAEQSEFLTRLRPQGIVKCPPEAALMLFLEYVFQPRGEVLDVAMDPLTTVKNRKYEFHEFDLSRTHDGSRYLTSSNYYGGGVSYDRRVRVLLARE